MSELQMLDSVCIKRGGNSHSDYKTYFNFSRCFLRCFLLIKKKKTREKHQKCSVIALMTHIICNKQWMIHFYFQSNGEECNAYVPRQKSLSSVQCAAMAAYGTVCRGKTKTGYSSSIVLILIYANITSST